MPTVSIGDLKKLLIESCVLKTNPETITADTPLFGPDSVGLDSLDALQLVVSIEKHYGIAITDSETAQKALRSLGTLRQWLTEQAGAGAGK
jgi:acyl carrier protein